MKYTEEELKNIEFFVIKYSDEILNPRFRKAWKKVLHNLIKQARMGLNNG